MLLFKVKLMIGLGFAILRAVGAGKNVKLKMSGGDITVISLFVLEFISYNYSETLRPNI